MKDKEEYLSLTRFQRGLEHFNRQGSQAVRFTYSKYLCAPFSPAQQQLSRSLGTFQQHRHVVVSSAPILQLGTHPPDCPHSLQVLTNHPTNEQRLTFFLCCR